MLALPLPFDVSRLILLGALTAARLVPVFLVAPFFGGRLVPAPLKVGVALTFGAVMFPAIEAATPSLRGVGTPLLAALFFKETVVGAAVGFLAALPFWAAEAAGRLVDTARGANLAEVLVPQTGTQSSPLGDLSLQLAIVLFFALDGHLVFVRALAASYEGVPVFGFPPLAGARAVGALLVASTAKLVLAALGLAAPALAALFLADLALGLMNRVSPQIQVFFVGMPAKALLGIGALFLAFGALATAVRRELTDVVGVVTRAIDLLR